MPSCSADPHQSVRCDCSCCVQPVLQRDPLPLWRRSSLWHITNSSGGLQAKNRQAANDLLCLFFELVLLVCYLLADFVQSCSFFCFLISDLIAAVDPHGDLWVVPNAMGGIISVCMAIEPFNLNSVGTGC